jgi:hypothetical protein
MALALSPAARSVSMNWVVTCLVGGVEVEGLIEGVDRGGDVAQPAEDRGQVVERGLVVLPLLRRHRQRLQRQRDGALVGRVLGQDVGHHVQCLHGDVHLRIAVDGVYQRRQQLIGRSRHAAALQGAEVAKADQEGGHGLLVLRPERFLPGLFFDFGLEALAEVEQHFVKLAGQLLVLGDPRVLRLVGERPFRRSRSTSRAVIAIVLLVDAHVGDASPYFALGKRADALHGALVGPRLAEHHQRRDLRGPLARPSP